MKKRNIISEKSYCLSVKVVTLCTQMLKQHKEPTLFRQLLNSGTSVGANVQEAITAESHKDFIHKISIAQKEAKETMYWLELLTDSKIITLDQGAMIKNETREVLLILSKILITSRARERSVKN